jgi:hypothetical protein
VSTDSFSGHAAAFSFELSRFESFPRCCGREGLRTRENCSSGSFEGSRSAWIASLCDIDKTCFGMDSWCRKNLETLVHLVPSLSSESSPGNNFRFEISLAVKIFSRPFSSGERHPFRFSGLPHHWRAHRVGPCRPTRRLRPQLRTGWRLGWRTDTCSVGTGPLIRPENGPLYQVGPALRLVVISARLVKRSQ